VRIKIGDNGVGRGGSGGLVVELYGQPGKEYEIFEALDGYAYWPAPKLSVSEAASATASIASMPPYMDDDVTRDVATRRGTRS
jgi:hypothetical protein